MFRKRNMNGTGAGCRQVLTLLIAMFSISFANAQDIDLLLKGGHVIDPKNDINEVMDVAVTDGKILRVAKDIPESSAKKTINVEGLYVTPGLIDMHAHVFNGTNPMSYIADGHTSVAPDAFSFRTGVTTMVDAGSSGWRNFRDFKEQTIDRSKTRVLAFLNIVGIGMLGRFEEQDVSDMNPVMTAHMIKKMFPDLIVGIKAAHYWGGFTQVERAVEAGNLADVPVMVDFGEHQPPNSIEKLFMDILRPGDGFTHTYSYGPNNRETIVDAQGHVKPFVFEAQKRGIFFDVGHGGGAFSWRQAIPATRDGFWADVISTDLHTESMNAGMKGLDNVMSKFLTLGMPLEQVIMKTTWRPAQVINRPDLGHLSEGSEADITVLNLRTGKFGFLDIRGVTLEGDKKLEAEVTIRAGRVVWDLNGRAGRTWDDAMILEP